MVNRTLNKKEAVHARALDRVHGSVNVGGGSVLYGVCSVCKNCVRVVLKYRCADTKGNDEQHGGCLYAAAFQSEVTRDALEAKVKLWMESKVKGRTMVDVKEPSHFKDLWSGLVADQGRAGALGAPRTAEAAKRVAYGHGWRSDVPISDQMGIELLPGNVLTGTPRPQAFDSATAAVISHRASTILSKHTSLGQRFERQERFAARRGAASQSTAAAPEDRPCASASVAHRPADLPSTPEPQLRREKKDEKPPEECCEDWLNLAGVRARVAADVKAPESQLAQVVESFGLLRGGFGIRYSAAAMQRKLEILMNPPPLVGLLKLLTTRPVVLIPCRSPNGAGTGVGFVVVPHHSSLKLPLGSALQQEALPGLFHVDHASVESWLNSLPAPLRPDISSAFEENLNPSDALARATNQDGSANKLYTIFSVTVKLLDLGHPLAEAEAVADAGADDGAGRNDTGASGPTAALAPQLPDPSAPQPPSSQKQASYRTLSTAGLGGSTFADMCTVLSCDTGALGPNEAAACVLISTKLDKVASAGAVSREEMGQIIRNHNELQTNAKLELGLFRAEGAAGGGASDLAEDGDDPVDVREADQAQEDKENAQATLKDTERMRQTLERASRAERRAATGDRQVRLRLRGCSDTVSSGTIPAKGVAVQRMELGSVTASYDGQTRAAGGPLGRLLGHFSAGRAGLRQLFGMLQSGFGPALAQQATSLKAKLFGGGSPATAQA